MNKFAWKLSLVFLIAPLNSLAHHSHAPYDIDSVVSIRGTVIDFVWRNPHVFLKIERQNPDGSVAETEVEADAAAALVPFGTSPDSVTEGEIITVVASPHRRLGMEAMLGREIIKADGSVFGLTVAYARQLVTSGSAQATSIEGTWLPEQHALFSLLNAPLPLSDRAREAAAQLQLSDSPWVSCIPDTAPSSMLYPALSTIEFDGDVIRFRSDWLGAEREVYMDGRAHPADLEPSLQGHSIGRWEGETLVVDSVGFTEHRRGLVGRGVPSSLGKRVVERFTLGPDGSTLSYEYVLTDPEYLLEPVSGTFTLYYRPDMQPTNIECDLESARRALEIEAEN